MKKIDLNKKITEHYDDFRKKLLEQLTYTLGEERIKVYIDYLNEFQETLLAIEENLNRRLKNHQEENDLLRSLLGVGEVELKAQLLKQHQELLFLREEMLKLKSIIEARDKEIFEWKQKFSFSEEEKKVLVEDYQKQRKGYDEELKKINQELENLQRNILRERQEIASEKKNLAQEKENYRQKNYQEVWEYSRQLLAALTTKIRNVLGIIAGSGQWMQERIQKLRQQKLNPLVNKKIQKLLDEIAPDLDNIMKNINPSIRTLEDFQDLLGDKLPVPGPVNLENVFRNVSNQLSSLIMNKRAEIVWPKPERKQKLPTPAGNEEKITIAIKEIVKNALESMVQGIRVEVIISETPEEVRIDISNNGPKIRPADEDKIFRPFFSTKTEQNGLGLVRAKKNIMDCAGYLYFDSQKPQTTFRIVLPRHLT